MGVRTIQYKTTAKNGGLLLSYSLYVDRGGRGNCSANAPIPTGMGGITAYYYFTYNSVHIFYLRDSEGMGGRGSILEVLLGFYALFHPPSLTFKEPLFRGHALQRQNTEISKQIFPEKEYRGLSPNFHIHPSVSDLYIPTIGLPILLEEICRPILRLYKSLTDT